MEKGLSGYWLLPALALTSAVSIAVAFAYTDRMKRREMDEHSNRIEEKAAAYMQLIGNTPMVELTQLSAIFQCRILVKMESMNPGGTGKDRAASQMLKAARESPSYKAAIQANQPITIVEGTSGSTGIALACQCQSLGYRLRIFMPDDQADEKKHLLECLGAEVTIVPTCAISNSEHYVNRARKYATDTGGIFINQFENLANYDVHNETTGPEIWRQAGQKVDAFIMSSGTGGTIAGVSKYLKKKNPLVHICLADIHGSSLYNRVMHGVCFTTQQTERKIKKHRCSNAVNSDQFVF
jgi:cysteine synthase A